MGRTAAPAVMTAQPKHGQRGDLSPSAFVVRRVETEYQRQEDARRRAEAADELVRIEANARSEQQAQEAQRALSSPYRDLALALAWFRDEWQASFPRRIHEHDAEHQSGEVLGAPSWTERWKTWLSSNDPDRDADDPRPVEPLRRAWLALRASGSMFDRAGAEYLFRLACLDFAMERAALTMDPPLAHPYIAWYAEKAIDRLREQVVKERTKKPGTVGRPEWMDRVGIGKSEAQHAAEEAAVREGLEDAAAGRTRPRDDIKAEARAAKEAA